MCTGFSSYAIRSLSLRIFEMILTLLWCSDSRGPGIAERDGALLLHFAVGTDLHPACMYTCNARCPQKHALGISSLPTLLSSFEAHSTEFLPFQPQGCTRMPYYTLSGRALQHRAHSPLFAFVCGIELIIAFDLSLRIPSLPKWPHGFSLYFSTH